MLTVKLTDLLSLEKLLPLTLLRIVYLLGLTGIAIGSLATSFGAFGVMRFSLASGLGAILLAMFAGVIGVTARRAVCELWTVLFGIYVRLGQIRELPSSQAAR